MFDRRQLIGGLACMTSCSSGALAQWPNGARSDELPPQPDAALRGCMRGNLTDIIYTRIAVRGDVLLVDKIFIPLSDHFDVIRGVAVVFDGPDSNNALATPQNLVMQGSAGTVLIGRKLIEFHKRTFKGRWESALAASIGHETGHLAQYRHGLNLPTRTAELHADFLAGWGLQRLSLDSRFRKYADPRVAVDSLRALQGRSGNVSVHGTARERTEMFRAGWNYGESHRSREELFTAPVLEGLELLGVQPGL